MLVTLATFQPESKRFAACLITWKQEFTRHAICTGISRRAAVRTFMLVRFEQKLYFKKHWLFWPLFLFPKFQETSPNTMQKQEQTNGRISRKTLDRMTFASLRSKNRIKATFTFLRRTLWEIVILWHSNDFVRNSKRTLKRYAAGSAGSLQTEENSSIQQDHYKHKASFTTNHTKITFSLFFTNHITRN